jgi:hypothetical protein
MSKKKPSRVELIQLKYRCLYCSALRNQWCVTVNGVSTSILHSARFQQAKNAGELPIR